MTRVLVEMTIISLDIPTDDSQPSLDVLVKCGRFSTAVTILVSPQDVRRLTKAEGALRVAQRVWEEV